VGVPRGADAGSPTPDEGRRTGVLSGGSPRLALVFLLPALALLLLFLIYPIFSSAIRSTYDAAGDRFVGLDNYVQAFTDPQTLLSLRNTAIWVIVAPAVVTTVGLLFAVLTERIRWATAFRLVVFMPIAISLFASGIIFRLVYDQEPERGLANAITVSVHDAFSSPSLYPGARPRDPATLTPDPSGALVTGRTFGANDVAPLAITGLAPDKLPEGAVQAVQPEPGPGLRGLVWLDVGGGTERVIDPGERGMPGVVLQVLRDNATVATMTTGNDGRYVVPDLPPGDYKIRLAENNFTAPFRGINWFTGTLVTPVIISAWIWIMAGFAMTFIAAGLAAIPRDALEAARVDGATEWQVFRRVTVPLLSPVLLVVFVTLVITVLKIFDLVLVMAPGSVLPEANVLALQMWQVSFGGNDPGLGSALGILLFLLVLPAMIFNIRRFRGDQ